MSQQIELFPGQYFRDQGISKAIQHADDCVLNWSAQAYSFLTSYIRFNDTFMTEDLRAASVNIVPQPPSLRAWGGVMLRAVKSGLIKNAGYQKVKNPKAHCANAAVWETVKK